MVRTVMVRRVIAWVDASSGTTKLESTKLESLKLESLKLELIMSFGEDRIIRKSPEEIEKMRRSGKMVRQVLNHLKGVVAAGVTTMGLGQAPAKLIADREASPAVDGCYCYPCVLWPSTHE